MDSYSEIIRLRQVFKAITQISWEFNQLDKKYPVHEIPDKGMDGLLLLYKTLAEHTKKVTELI